ncbi:hypothetical protein OE88DRAFT_1662395 [Heliocybe sulcata]|uniref:Uncharacterized protein n=1 Tax=Heliocybe sulcata TaxID=5364 RepID=A0A5C3N7H8_9AGAM|nr:hypothetical protein OE88DRAFT_1662395 [Heliocybe sulcata]
MATGFSTPLSLLSGSITICADRLESHLTYVAFTHLPLHNTSTSSPGSKDDILTLYNRVCAREGAVSLSTITISELLPSLSLHLKYSAGVASPYFVLHSFLSEESEAGQDGNETRCCALNWRLSTSAILRALGSESPTRMEILLV